MKNTRNTLKIKNYTLVELLTVIAIISILAGLSMAGVSYARKQARITKAKADIASLVTAIKSYESTYRLLPVAKTDTGFTTLGASDDGNYKILMQLLAARNIDSASKEWDKCGNRRKIKFLDVPQNFKEKGFLDPWGNPYIIMLNSSYGDDITFDSKTLYGSVFVYSCGPNGTNDNGRNFATDKNSAGKDDICSWK